MKAVIYTRYGPPDVLHQTELPRPTPKSNEVLIRTRATTVTSGDWRARSLEMPVGFGVLARLFFGLVQPRQKLLGSELAGEVVAIGDAVTRFQVGDRVFAFTGARLGCYVQFKCLPEDDNVVNMPSNLTFAEAAALSFGGTTALDFLRKGGLKRGADVLINGASGGVGTMAVQIAKHAGANVTGVCSSQNADLVKSLGADYVIDYTRQDFTALHTEFDIVMDTVGTAPYSRTKECLKEDGRFLVVLGSLADMLRAPIVSLTSQHRIITGAAAERLSDLQEIARLAELGVLKPVIDRQYPIDEIVEAHRYVDTGRKQGNVVILWDAETGT